MKSSSSSYHSGSDLRRAWMASAAVRSWKSKWAGWIRAALRARVARSCASFEEASSAGMVRRARRR